MSEEQRGINRTEPVREDVCQEPSGTDPDRKKSAGWANVDWMITVVPFGLIIGLAAFLFLVPEVSNTAIAAVRFFLGDSMGLFYLVFGLATLGVALYLIFSKYGKIVLGRPDEKPRYSFFAWGSMMFTCGLAADILFYSFMEWVMYATNPHITDLGSFEEWAGVFPLFHWSFIPWAFYMVMAVMFGFMLHVRGRTRQRYSEACRPVIGKHAEGLLGRVIDLFALFALLAGTATTFSVATPLMSAIIERIFHTNMPRNMITIIILLITCAVYTYAVLHGIKGISFLANLCIYLFYGMLVYVVLFTGQGLFILENGVQSLGKMFGNFMELATYTDPARINNFPQDWTIYYWAYWMVWCIAAPFFIGKISRGRTVRQTVAGGFLFGIGSTIVSFIVLGNYSLGRQVSGLNDFIAQFEADGDMYHLIISIIDQMPGALFIMALTLVTMIAFYATSFDSIAFTAACYSYRKLEHDEKPNMVIQLLWCLLLIVLPMALVFSESSMNNIQSVSIISAFPIGIIMIVMMKSFFKDAKAYLEEVRRAG